MAEMGAHSALSGAMAIAINQTSIPLIEQTAIIVVGSTIGHLLLDFIPHGHTKKMWKEMISAVVLVPLIFWLSFHRGGWELFFLTGVALFFGNLFDALLKVSNMVRKRYVGGLIRKTAEKIIEFNLWIHWFVRSQTFCLGVRQEVSKETWNGRPVYSWEYSWYNFIPLVFSLIALYASLTL